MGDITKGWGVIKIIWIEFMDVVWDIFLEPIFDYLNWINCSTFEVMVLRFCILICIDAIVYGE